MADTKITALTAITTVDPAVDVLPIVDVSDTTMAASGTTKKITSNQILGAGGTATLASATITGDLTVDTSTLKVDSANNRVGILTATPLVPLHVETTGTGTTAFSNFVSTFRSQAAGRDVTLQFSDGTNQSAISMLSGALSFGTGGANTRYNIDSTGISTWSVGGSTAMTLNSTGLGVGASPTQKLHVKGVVNYEAISGTTNVWQLYTFSDNSFRWNYNGSGADELIIDSSGNVGVGVTPSASGGCLQLKSGITFPATQVASSDANTLDDYEEGTWTGSLLGGNANPTTPITATGRYTKVGRLVTLQINFDNVNTSGASGKVIVNGIPFTNAGFATYGSAASYLAATFSGTLTCVIDPNEVNAILLLDVKSNAAWATADHNAGAGRYVRLTITYTV